MWMPLGWVSASGAGGAAASFELISTTVLGSSTASVTFNLTAGQQAAYKHLQVRAVMRADDANTYQYGLFRINGDTGSNYADHRLTGNGSAVSSGADITQVGMYIGDYAGNTAPTGAFGAMIADYLDAFSTTKYKTVRYFIGHTSGTINLRSGLWMNTAAISSLTYANQDGGNFLTGSRFSLYGVRA